MRIFSTTAAFAIMASLLAGCGGQDTGQSMAEGENQQASQQSASDIYMPAETAMNERMAAAEGASAADTWMLKMIEHHRGAISLSELLLSQPNVEPAVAERARMTAADQQRDVAELQSMLQGVQGTGSPDAYMAAEQQMSRQMMAARGANVSETWLRKMIEHHRGAVAMANIAVTSAGNEMVIAMARQTIEKQTREIAELQRLLPS
ncbi:DUF305 domain-containing protein [Vitreimonas flagellata]|jgi:uncharacterized protein (DUF305 family)|uniref:DUF305 domain-containing protein n=1 Tax=Vitreimonas flagellata TaxID=2560861 RepID=UPI0010750B3A|nr:DUF305 domain-containing protein [Vitreimonas flagellata]